MHFKLLSAIGLGALALLLSIFAGGVWTVLLVANLRSSPGVPWSVPAMGLLLWLMWRYLEGHGPPRGNSASRHSLLRASPVSGRAFVWSMIAGMLGVIALAGLWIVLAQIAHTHGRGLPDFSPYPLVTVIAVIGMACLVSSVAEEAAVRGYCQGYLERHLRGTSAILISSLLLAPAHSLTQGFVWPVMLFYFLVDVMLGTLAYLTKSILPGLVVHIMGLLVFFTLIWPRDALRPTLGNSAGMWFWVHVGQTGICAALALIAFRRLAQLESKSLSTA